MSCKARREEKDGVLTVPNSVVAYITTLQDPFTFYARQAQNYALPADPSSFPPQVSLPVSSMTLPHPCEASTRGHRPASPLPSSPR